LNKRFLEKTEEYIHNKNWYLNSNNLIKSKFKNDYILFIKLLAVTSPRNTVKRNTFLALKTFDYIKTNKTIDFSYGIANKQIKNNVNRVINGKYIKGKKINSFIDSLLLKDGSICIDVWMLKAFNIKRIIPTNKDIRIISKTVKTIAKKLNLKTYEVQACLWCYAKKELNDSVHKEYKDFSSYLNFKITRQAVLCTNYIY
jgi:hypothetical protein